MRQDNLPLGMDPVEARDLGRLRPPASSLPPRPGNCKPTVLFLEFYGVLHSAAGQPQLHSPRSP
jgi:hypothetical protein